MSDGPAVYAAIATIQGELAKVGIAKERRNQQGSGYNFRGIDDVYAALSPLLARHGLCVLPRVLSREQVERVSQKGGALFYTTVHVEFDFVAVADGTCHTVATFGEAMDSGDKSTNKAMSAAYKYAAFMAFAIPVDGEPDADQETHQVQSGPAPRTVLDGPHTSKTALKNEIHAIRAKVARAQSEAEIDTIMRDGKETVKQAHRDWPELLDGDPNIAEDDGLRGYVAMRRQDFQLADADDSLAAFIEEMKQFQTGTSLAAWVASQEAYIESLGDADRRRFELAYNNCESAIQLVGTVHS